MAKKYIRGQSRECFDLPSSELRELAFRAHCRWAAISVSAIQEDREINHRIDGQ